MAVFDPNDEENKNHSEGSIAAIMVLLVVAILAVVFIVNRSNSSTKKASNVTSPAIENEEQSEAMPYQAPTDKRTSDELDIWNLDFGKEDGVTNAPTGAELVTSIPSHSNEIEITFSDGSTQYAQIDSKIKKNRYASSSFSYQKPQMMYYESGNKISYFGIMLSDADKNVDMGKLKDSGFDFVMLRGGYRDTRSGELVKDTAFLNFFRSAIQNEIQIGVYFTGQADDIVRLREEAAFLVDLLKEDEITYPVAYLVEPVNDSVDFVDNTGKNLRTQNLVDYCKMMEEEGLLPMVCADKETLVLKMNLTELADYKIWLLEPGDLPNYPYAFSIWNYSDNEAVPGVEHAKLLIGMEDLTAREITKDESYE